MLPALQDIRPCIIGLGYVGLPLAVEFGKHYPTTGFDIDTRRVAELQSGHDRTLEVSAHQLAESQHVRFTADLAGIAASNVYIVTVPTPIDRYKRPDLGPLLSASRTIGSVLKRGDIVIYESTVYPGCTEEDCVPVLEKTSGLRFNQDFFAGYSPERINPGDTQRRLPDILKVTSGSTPEVADLVDHLYASIIRAGTHRAPSIKVAEAAKIIENTQRDINIALVNELALIFARLGIDTQAVLAAAGTKWNFLPFKPGLVGGHCIGVDPYYLTHKAQELGYHPEVILAGRRINDNMGHFVADSVLKAMTRKKLQVVGARVLVLGLTFKEDCPDTRNTRVIDLIRELQGYHAEVDIYDPWADAADVHEEYGLALTPQPEAGAYDAVILCVAHQQFKAMGVEGIRALAKPVSVLFDVKGMLPAEAVDGRL
jgi:UDP-N-acetyl-D-galactosamine dehydrogenase